MWHSITAITTRGDAAATAEVLVPQDALWFDGHFPGMPLLPGIAQLAMVEEVLTKAWTTAGRAIQFSRVRFKLRIAPGTPVTVKVSRQAETEDHFSFQIITPQGIACLGLVRTGIQSSA
ncbi:MAG: hypothetical protein QNJ22_14450 [Desulfosarcinaceae bacterium]|nr:hypothetical protein [Desulfosarcinaceae bacterium]